MPKADKKVSGNSSGRGQAGTVFSSNGGRKANSCQLRFTEENILRVHDHFDQGPRVP